MADDAIELSFDPAGDAAVVDVWERLRFCGIPSQADHARGMTNAPHLSLVVASQIPDRARELARSLVLPLLPLRVEVRGVVVLGAGSRVSIAWLAELDADAVKAVGRVRDEVPLLRHPHWLPHITLARRVPRELLGGAFAEIGGGPGTITADRVRWWDASAGTVETLADAPDPPRT